VFSALREHLSAAKERKSREELERMGYMGDNLKEFSELEQRKILKLLARCPKDYYLDLLEDIKEKPGGS